MNALWPYPEQASSLAGEVDALFWTLTAVTGAVTLLIAFLLVFFSVRYRRQKVRERGSRLSKKTQTRMEIAWTILPLLVFLVFFGWGADLYLRLEQAPADPLQLQGIAKQWMWKFQHPDGQREINELHVPLNRPVQITLVSQDVIHSFFVPAFRVKQDVLPGRYTQVWFEPIKTGEYHLFCAEFCGTEHSQMRGRVIVMEQAEYQQWLDRQGAVQTPAERGAALFRALGCSGCHFNSKTVRAPSLYGLYGRPVAVAINGAVTTVIADEGYIRDAILLPEKHIVAGFEPIMPSFQGQLGEDDLLDIIAYVKSLDLADRYPQP